MRDARSLLRGYLSVFSGDLGRILIFALFTPLLVRVVGDAGFGTYALVMAVFLPIRKVTNAGLFEATKTYVARAESTQRSRLVASSLAVHLGLLLLVLPLLTTVVWLGVESRVLRDSFLLVALALVGEQLFNFGRGVLHALHREELAEGLIPLRSVVLAAVGLWLASSAYGAGLGVPGVFAGFAVGFLLVGGIATAVALHVSGVVTERARPALREHAPRLLRFGAPSMVLVLLTVGLYKIDILLVSHFLDPSRTGYYRAALQIAEFLWVGAIGMELLMIQSTSALWAEHRMDEIERLLGRALRFVLPFTLLLVVGVFVLADEFAVRYYGPTFLASVQPMHLLLPGVLGFAVARVVWPVMQAGGHLRAIVGATAVAVAVNVVLTATLIPRWGITGAAVGTSVAYGLMAVLHLGVARRAGIDPLPAIPVVRIAGVTLVTGVVLLAANLVVAGLPALILLPPLGLAVYGAGSLWLGVVSIDELRDVAGSAGLGSAGGPP